MDEYLFIKQDGNNIWNGTVLLQLDSPLKKMSDTLTAFLLEMCHKLGCMMEWMTDSRYGKKRTYLIIRKAGPDKEYVMKVLMGCTEALIKIMEGEGFRLSRHTNEELESISAAMKARENLLLCVPGENKRNIGFCYVPGGYDLISQIDFAVLDRIISTYSDCGISVILDQARYSDQEMKVIRDNIAWLENFGEFMDVMLAKNAYRQYAAMSMEAMYAGVLTVWGSQDSLQKLVKELSGSGFDFAGIPQESLGENAYIMNGHKYVEAFAFTAGHVLRKGIALLQGAERLNYLVTEDTIRRLGGAICAIRKPVNQPKTNPNPLDPLQNPLNPYGNPDAGSGAGSDRGAEDQNGLVVGKSLADNQEVKIPWNMLSKHMAIAGMPGFGKTTLMFQILNELKNHGLPFLIIEPTKTEYRELMKAIPDLKVLTPGRTDINPIMFNPFLPPKGITLEQYLPSLITAFQIGFTLTTPLDVIFQDVIRTCYTRYGWRNDSTSESEEVEIFGMSEFIHSFKEEVSNSAYDEESKNNLLSGGVYRFQSLIDINPFIFDTEKSIDIEELMKGHTLIELDAIDNAEHKALLLVFLLLQIKLVIRKRQFKDSKLKNILMIDEAHVLLNPSGVQIKKNEADASGKLLEFLIDMVKVNRAYGTGMIFADQSYSLLGEIASNTNVKAIMHLESSDDRMAFASSLADGSSAYQQLPELGVGEFLLTYEKLGGILRVKGNDVRGLLDIPVDVDDESVREKMKAVFAKPFKACPCRNCCDIQIRKEAEYISRKIYLKMGKALGDPAELKEYVDFCLDDDIEELAQDFDNEKKLKKCARMMAMRMIRQKGSPDYHGSED